MGKLRLLLFFAMLVGLMACRHDAGEMVELQVCDTVNVTYSGSVVSILQARCALPGCHVPGGNGTGDFTTYAGVLSQVTNGKLVPAARRTGGAIPMPPDGSSIPECEITIIEVWVSAGAMQN